MSLLQKEDPSKTGNPQAGDPNPNPNPNPQDWRTALPEDIRSEKVFEKFKDLGSLGKSYLEMEKYQGQSVKIPNDKSTDDDRHKFFVKVGKPEAVDKYEFKRPDALPEGVSLDEERIKGFREVAFQSHLTKAQAQAVFEYALKEELKKLELGKASIEDGMKELKKRWEGATENNLDLVSNVSKSVFRKSFGKLEASGIANDPDFIEDIHDLGRSRFMEDQFVSGDSIATQNNAQEKIQAIMSNKDHPYHKGDPKAVQEMAKLYQIAYPEPV